MDTITPAIGSDFVLERTSRECSEWWQPSRCADAPDPGALYNHFLMLPEGQDPDGQHRAIDSVTRVKGESRRRMEGKLA